MQKLHNPLSSYYVQGWTCSVLLHASAICAAVWLVADIKPQIKEPFRWEVSMVDAVSALSNESGSTPPEEPPAPEPPSQAEAPEPAPVAPAPPVRSKAAPPPVASTPVPPAKPMRPESEVARSAQAEHQMETHQHTAMVSEPERTDTPPPVETQTQAVKDVEPPPVQPSEPVPPREASPEETPMESAIARDPALHREISPPPPPQDPPVQREITPPTPEPVEQRPVEPAVASARSADPEPIQHQAPEPKVPVQEEAKPVESPPLPAPEPPAAVRQPQEQQTAAPAEDGQAKPSAPPNNLLARSMPGARPDYGWLTQTLWRRIEQLKRYPQKARLNRWEGTVVVKAVIRGDGHFSTLTMEKSSGYDELDQDALELLRRASPLPLKQQLGRSEVTIRIPISYRLE